MPSPRHNTTKAFPAVAKGFFKMLEDIDDIELGDIVYVPEYFACSPSTLRSGGLSVGDTCRSDNKTEIVKKIFGSGHKAMYLLATEVQRRREQPSSVTRWDGRGMVLTPQEDRTPANANTNQIVAKPVQGRPPIARVKFTAIPADSFNMKTVAEAVATSPAVQLSDLRAAANEKLVTKLSAKFKSFFVLRNDGTTYRQGMPLAGDEQKRDPGTWLIHALLDYADHHCGGVDGTVSTEAWQQDNEFRTEVDSLVETIRDRYLSVPDVWKKDTLNVYNRNYSSRHAPFLEFLRDHGCTFLHRDGFYEEIRDQMVREMADQMVERIVKTAGIFREFLPTAVEGALKRLDDLADTWAGLRDEVRPEAYTEPASALAETEPTTRYGVKRGR